MNKYQEALDKFVRWNAMLKLYGITAQERHTSAKHTLQELVDKHEKLREYLKEKKKEYEPFVDRDDYNGAYSDGATYILNKLLDYLDKENGNKDD